MDLTVQRAAFLLGFSILIAFIAPAPGAFAQHPSGGVSIEDDDDELQAPDQNASFRVLVFSKTAGFRHASIEDGVKAIRKLGQENGFAVDHTENGGLFTEANLKKYRVIIFLSTTRDVLNDQQQEVFKRYINRGGGFVGVHAAADTEYDWPWYGELVGAYFKSHPAVQDADIYVVDQAHPATHHLAAKWTRRDEWYDYRAEPREGVTVLMTLDEASYEGGKMGESHPIAWCHEFDGGRSFYTGGGHTKESFAEPEFLKHLLGGIRWAAKVAESAS